VSPSYRYHSSGRRLKQYVYQYQITNIPKPNGSESGKNRY